MNNDLKSSESRSNSKLVCFLCNGFPTISETFIISQISNAIDNGFRVSIHADYINNNDRPLLENDEKISKMLSATYVRQHAPDSIFKRIVQAFVLAKQESAVISLAKSLNPFRFGVHALNFRNFFSYSSLLSLDKPDLIHAQFGPNGIKAVNAKLNGVVRCPIVTSFHGYDAHTESSQLTQVRKFYSRLFKHGDLFLVNGNYLKQQLVDLGCPNFKIIKLPLGVDLNKFKPLPSRPDIGKGNVKFITIGRLIKLKNQKFGIELLNLLRSKGVNASYTIIGSGPEIDNLKTLAQNLHVDRYVHFLGSLTQEEICRILPQHHIFLMTSYKDSSGRMETQGIVSAEAQACGLPVISLGFGGTADTIVHGVTGFNLSSSNPESGINYVYDLINSTVYAKFSYNARAFISENYNIKITNKHLIKIYEELILESENQSLLKIIS